MTGGDFCLGALVGTPTGAALALLIVVALRRQQRVEDEPLTEQDFAVLTEDFRRHAGAMRQQVSDYADSLANGDRVLRERLRRFEG